MTKTVFWVISAASAAGAYPSDLESEPPAEVGYHHVVPLRYRNSIECIRQVSLVDGRYSFERSDHDLLSRWGLDFLYDNHVTHSDASIVPDDAVNPYHSSAFV